MDERARQGWEWLASLSPEQKQNVIDETLAHLKRQDEAEERARIGRSVPGAVYHPGDRITWISSVSFRGPYTSIVLGTDIFTSGDLGYWCETAPESEQRPTHIAARYWVYPRDIDLARQEAMREEA